MGKNYIIDGFNLGFKIPSVAKWISSGDTDRAVQLIKNYIFNALIKKADKVIIVFDGKKGVSGRNSKQGKMQIIFSHKPETADDIIRHHLRSLKNASQWIVISTDCEIRYTAEDMGAQSVTSEDFIVSINQESNRDQYKTTKDKYQPENVDVNYWLNKFNQSGENSQ